MSTRIRRAHVGSVLCRPVPEIRSDPLGAFFCSSVQKNAPRYVDDREVVQQKVKTRLKATESDGLTAASSMTGVREVFFCGEFWSPNFVLSFVSLYFVVILRV